MQKMKIDPWKHKEKYLKWKEKAKDGIPDISKENSEIILKYLRDMEMGLCSLRKLVRLENSMDLMVKLNNK